MEEEDMKKIKMEEMRIIEETRKLEEEKRNIIEERRKWEEERKKMEEEMRNKIVQEIRNKIVTSLEDYTRAPETSKDSEKMTETQLFDLNKFNHSFYFILLLY